MLAFVYLLIFLTCGHSAVIDNNDISVDFYYQSRQNERVKLDDTNLNIINVNLPIKILIHPWLENGQNAPFYKSFTREYLKRGDYGIILIDWGTYSKLGYTDSAKYTKYVGIKIGNFIIELHKNYGVDFKNIHLLGFSLGAHVAGFIGKQVTELTVQKIGRITGLDPAGPIFNDALSIDRLHQTDAIFVDIVHTDPHGYGVNKNLGTIDFYVNEGRQPGCVGITNLMGCSHKRSHEIYVETILTNLILATECENYQLFKNGACNNNKKAIFGEDVSKNSKGTFYLETNSVAPYAII